MKLLEPYIKNTCDIYGFDDLNNLIGKHPNVEQRHFKLWISSTEALRKFFERSDRSRSEQLIERVRNRLCLYVQNKSYDRALEKLRKHHACIIAGAPGIGKTTLADVLMIQHVDQDYEVIVLSRDISEADRLFQRRKKQIFYYDDFLGTAFDEHLPKNEDSRILAFIRRVKNQPNKRLILTTREYILRSAEERYEKVNSASRLVQKCTISLEDYTTNIRAKILYNHIYFSQLGQVACSAIVENRRYMNVIKHENFNPRIIEYAIEFSLAERHSPENFPNFLTNMLDNPDQLWNHAFRQLPSGAQGTLLVLIFLPDRVYLSDLYRAAAEFVKIRSGEFLAQHEFKKHLRVIEGTFLSLVERRQGFKENCVEFQSPSVRDFILHYISSDLDEITLLIKASVYFEQLANICQAATTREHNTYRYEKLMEGIYSEDKLLAEKFNSLLNSSTCAPALFFSSNQYSKQPSEDERIATLVELAEELPLPAIQELYRKLVESAYSRWLRQEGNREAIAKIIKTLGVPQEVKDGIKPWATSNLDSAADFSLASAVIEPGSTEAITLQEDFDLFADAQEYYITTDADTADEAQSIAWEVETIAKGLNLELKWNEDAIFDAISSLEDSDKDEDEFDYDRANEISSQNQSVDFLENQAIDRLFSTLITERHYQ